MHFRFFVPVLLALLGGLVLGCGGDASNDDAGGGSRADAFSTSDAFVELRPSCELIVAACHDVDPGSGPIHDCHELGHAETATEAACAAQLVS